MKLKEEMILKELDNEGVIVPVGKVADSLHGIICLNETATFLVKLLKNNITEATLVQALLNEYEVDKTTAVSAVNDVIAKLRELGAIEEDN